MNKNVSEKVKDVVRKSVKDNSRVEVPLYRRQKGKGFHASGTWQATEGERRLIETFGCLFFFGIFLGLIMGFIHSGTLSSILLGIGIIGAIGTFVSLFAIIFRKNRKEPMEVHYYDTDYRYNAITGEETDKSKEITKEEFLGKK